MHNSKLFINSIMLLILLNCWYTVPKAYSQGSNPSGFAVANMAYNRDDGKDAHAWIEMTLFDKNGKQKTRKLEMWNKDYGKLNNGLIRFTSPASIEGTGFLNIEKTGQNDDQHLFLPSLRRSRRIVSSQRDGKFVNTDFTFEDMERAGGRKRTITRS